MTVEAKIKQYIDENRIPQKTLSAQTGITQAKLNLSLNEKRRLSFLEYELICGALSVAVDKFLEARIPTAS